MKWNDINQAIFDSWADYNEAVEAGSTCLALWIIEKFTDLKVTRRSFQGTGFDYWLGMKNEKSPFRDVARLEISGMLREKAGRINQRLKEKSQQVEKSNHFNLPAYIIVIEFSQLLAKTKMV